MWLMYSIHPEKKILSKTVLFYNLGYSSFIYLCFLSNPKISNPEIFWKYASLYFDVKEFVQEFIFLFGILIYKWTRCL